MTKIAWKGGALLAPVPPVMVTCGDMESSNIITVAWTGLINTHPPRLSIAIRPSRHSYAIIKERGEFAVNLTPASLVKECDYCGIYTGAKVDKFEKTGLHRAPATAVACPIIEECPLALECKVLDIIPQGTHDLFLAEVVAVDVDESILDGQGRLCLDRAGLAAFAHGEYFALGEKLGKFGCSMDKKGKGSTPQRRAAPPKTAVQKASMPKPPAPKPAQVQATEFKPHGGKKSASSEGKNPRGKHAGKAGKK